MFSRFRTAAIALALSVVVFGSAAVAFTSCGGGEDETPTEEIYQQIGGGGGGRDFVLYLDELIDRLPAEEPMSVSDADIVLWELEILPYFGYEGLVNFPVVPSAVTLTPYLDPMQHNHILGRAYCQAPSSTVEAENRIEMNARTANPHSAWFGAGDRFLPTLVHELIHIQGVCGSGAHSETATQVATYEVLAAMVNHGNMAALRPLLEELRDIALAAMQLDALEAGDEAFAEFTDFQSEVMGSAEADARFQKSMRFWSQSVSHRSQLRYILRAYNAEVFDHIVHAFGNNGRTAELYLPQYLEAESRIDLDYDGTRTFEIDDLIYFINNAEEIVEEHVEDGTRG